MKWLIYFIYRVIVSTWRIQVIESPGLQQSLANRKPVVFAHWHGDELSIIHLVTRYHLSTMTSTSRDGSLVDFVIQKFGGSTARGSSTRGAITGFRGLVRLVKIGHNASIAVDGPRGPYHEPKPGIFELSRICDAPIVPTGVAAIPSHRFEKSWNKTFLPYPFAKVVIVFADPITPSELQQSQNPTLLLKTALDTAQQQAGKIIAAC